jgi:twitching motility protein PilT
MAWLDTLYTQMTSEGASDLHMTSGQVPKFRLHGDIGDVRGQGIIPPERMANILLEIAPSMNWKQFEAEHDTDFAYELPGIARIRCNYFMDRYGPGAVFRQIPCEILTAEQLNLPQSVMDLCFLSKGLVVVTGPTGSGKSTTLAAMVDHINKNRSDHIITIEDPIEFVHEPRRCLINQREVHRHTESFKRALRAALREDPDIVLVGEMRDLETIEIAIETAETGHLVFGTLHTTTAPSTVDRIIDQFPADRQAQIRTMLSSSLKGVIAQTLCKKKPKGRVAALEIMLGNTAVAANIREGKTHQIVSAMQMGGKAGMRLLNDSLLELVSKGLVDPVEAYVKSVSKDDMQTKLASIGKAVDPSKLGESPAPAGHAPSAAPAVPPRAPAAAPVAAAVPPRAPLPKAPAPSGAPSVSSIPPAPSPAGIPPATPQAPASAPAKPGYVDPFDQFKKGRG